MAAQSIIMELPEENPITIADRYNYYKCRFCDFNVDDNVELNFDNGDVCLELLKKHYIIHHPVTNTIVDETTEFYQDGKKIAVLSKTHKTCCFENCQNNRTAILKKQLNKLAIRLLYGGIYPQFDIYFDNYHYELEPYVFSCGDLFEETNICSADLLLQWISQYGLMRTFTLKIIVQKKNKNLLMLKRIPKIKDQEVKDEITKLVNEKKEIEKRASKCLNISASLTKTVFTQAKNVEIQASLHQSNVQEKKDEKAILTSQILQLSNYILSLGHTPSFDVSNQLVISFPSKIKQVTQTETETETEESQNKKKRLD